MALVNGRKTIPVNQYPDELQPIRFSITTAGGIPTTLLAGLHFERDTIIDRIVYYPTADLTGTSANDATVTVNRKEPSATSIPIGSTNQITSLDLSQAAIGTPIVGVIDETENFIQAGGSIHFDSDILAGQARGEFLVYARHAIP